MSAPVPIAPSADAPVPFLGLEFDTLSLDAVLQHIAARDPQAAFGYLVTPNVDHLVRLENAPPSIREAYAQAELCLCDSRVVNRLARFAGVALSVVPGSDLVREMMERTIAPGDVLCLIGASPEAASELAALYPAVTILQHSPPMGLLGNTEARQRAIDFAAQAHARLVLLAVGSPQQEVLACEMRASKRVTGFGLCIGASIDFLTGKQSRAPRLVQRAGFEWAWRLASEPRRLWRRYLVEGPAIFGMVWRWRQSQKRT